MSSQSAPLTKRHLDEGTVEQMPRSILFGGGLHPPDATKIYGAEDRRKRQSPSGKPTQADGRD